MPKVDGKEMTALIEKDKGEMSTAGAFMPADFESFIAGGGFASIQTVMLGDPQDGKFPFYIGRLIGPGADISINDGETKQPTWSFNPAVRTADGRIGYAENITHIIPASYMVHAACSRIFDKSQRDKVNAIVGMKYDGQGRTKKGRALNQYQVFEKYEAK